MQVFLPQKKNIWIIIVYLAVKSVLDNTIVFYVCFEHKLSCLVSINVTYQTIFYFTEIVYKVALNG